jgi:hypothetical protein
VTRTHPASTTLEDDKRNPPLAAKSGKSFTEAIGRSYRSPALREAHARPEVIFQTVDPVDMIHSVYETGGSNHAY